MSEGPANVEQVHKAQADQGERVAESIRKESSHFIPHNKKRTFKIIVIGDSGVGKTCLTFRFCSGHFPGATEATIGVDFREKLVKVDKEEIRLQLWDTAGQERFRRSMVSHYYRNVSAVVLVYDVTRKASFLSMKFWISECEKHGLLNMVPVLMVGNKCEDGMKMAVNTNEAQRFADDHNMPLFETSAKDDNKADHVDAIFMTLAHKIKLSKPFMDAKKFSVNQNNSTRILYQNENYFQSENSNSCCF